MRMLYSITDFNLQAFNLKFSFNRRKRIDFYRVLEVLLRNNVTVNESLSKIYDVYSNNGSKKSNHIAQIVHEIRRSYNNVASLSKALAPWVPYEEMVLIRAGEKTGTIGKQLLQAIKQIKSKGRFVKSIVKCLAYPIVIMLMISYLMYVVAYKVVPPMSKVTDPATWSGVGRLLAVIADFTVTYGIWVGIAFLMLFIGCILSLPYSFGNTRVFLDRVPPWSIYRVIQGSNFLLNIAVLLSSGIKLENALRILRDGASPWLIARIDAILYSTSNGKDFGSALDISGYEFPDKKIIPVIKALSDTGRIDEVLYNYADEWVEQSIETIDGVSNLIFSLGIIFAALLVMLVMAGSNSIMQSAQSLYF